jgi:hypothetical protein
MKTLRVAVALAVVCIANLQAEQPAAKPFKEEELASLLAPIALYPDNVVTQVLMASTYPLEVVAANRWVQANTNLKGDALATEAAKQGWDPSVTALTALPDVLKSMDTKLDWTQKVGDAFLAQQKEVMDMIQTLRQKAKKEGNLESSEQLKVKTEPAAPQPATSGTAAAPAPQVIVIESANPQTVYVPTYPPTVYGAWAYPAYPPYPMPPPPGYPGSGFWLGLGVTVAVVNNNYWHNSANWGGGTVNIGEINIGNTGGRNNINGGGNWQHNPAHRGGTAYRDNATASKYDRGASAGASSRESYRGRDSSPSASTRATGGASSRNTPSASTRDSGGAGAGNRASSPSASSRSSSPSSGALGGMSSGSSASRSSSRGGASRGGGGGRRR